MADLTAAKARVLGALEVENAANPYGSKRLVGPDINYGRELLAALARTTGGWVGWEATSLRRIAGEIAFVPLHMSGTRVGGDVEIGMLVNRALECAMDDGAVSREFALLGRGLGFRKALRDSLLELRIAGITEEELENSTRPGTPASEVSVVMREYERVLKAAGVTDSAGVFASALEHFDEQHTFCIDGSLYLSPMLMERGLPGLLLDRLVDTGAKPLDGDLPIGVSAPRNVVSAIDARLHGASAQSSLLAYCGGPEMPPPDDGRIDRSLVSVDMFVAATPMDEMKEVLRRVIGEGLRLDEVEIAATDFDTYAVALDAICGRTGTGCSMLHGIPLTRTRLGRAMERWFAWLENGLPADMLRQALEAGEIGSGIDVEPPVLARELRAARVGWGRARYEEAVRRMALADQTVRLKRYESESEGSDDARVAKKRRGVDGLRTLLESILSATPATPDRDSDLAVRGSASELASATLAWLRLFNVHGNAERETCERVRNRLEVLVELGGASTSFGTALATLRDALVDVRAWPLNAEGAKPWSAGGGMVHLTDLAHAGVTDRRRIFVVGLDADLAGASARQDALIPDAVRASFVGRMASTTDRREERGFMLATALASLRGRVTLSYASTRGIEGSDAGPAAYLLQVQRLLAGNETLSYAQFRDSLGAPACSVPAHARAAEDFALDARDVWLGAISDGALLLDGETLVRQCFSSLDAGMNASAMARSDELSQFVGYIPELAGKLDPRDRPERAISPSALERLAACPLSWFYRYGLGLYLPDDPEWDPDRWLNSAERGLLLHEVFESFATQFAERKRELRTEAAQLAMDAIVEAAIAKWKIQVPPPRSVVVDGEIKELRRAALSFLEMERGAVADGDAATWRFQEYAFGAPEPEGTYALSDGTSLNVKGRVDRIDEMPDGTFRVVDYKSGSPNSYRKIEKQGLFNGARQLQPAIYSGVLAKLLNGSIARFEYRFPTERGQNQIIGYDASELDEARAIITKLLDHVSTGAFVPTNAAADCRYCDARGICRVTDEGYGKTASPRATWAAEHSEVLPVYAGMLQRRSRGSEK